MPIKTIIDQFIQYGQVHRGYSDTTVNKYQSVISFFVKFSNLIYIDDLTKDHVLAFCLYGRTERNWSKATFATYIKSLHVFFKWCVKQKYMETDYTEGIEVPSVQRGLPRGLSKDKAQKLIEIVYNYPYSSEFMRQRNRAIFATFLFTGIRRNELLSLMLTDIDLKNNTLFVRQGKGSKDRIVPINNTLATMLVHYLAERKKERKTCPQFFISSTENGGLTQHGLKKIVDKFKALIPFSFNLHQLRHTFATLMLNEGCDIFNLSKMLGHSDVKTTLIYAGVSTNLLRSEMKKHPLSFDNPNTTSGVIPKHTVNPHSEYDTQELQQHKILRQNELPQCQYCIRYQDSTRHSIPHSHHR